MAASAPLRCPKQPQLSCKHGSLGHIRVNDTTPALHTTKSWGISVPPLERASRKVIGLLCLHSSSPSALGGSVHCTQDTIYPHQRPGPLLSLSYESRKQWTGAGPGQQLMICFELSSYPDQLHGANAVRSGASPVNGTYSWAGSLPKAWPWEGCRMLALDNPARALSTCHGTSLGPRAESLESSAGPTT